MHLIIHTMISFFITVGTVLITTGMDAYCGLLDLQLLLVVGCLGLVGLLVAGVVAGSLLTKVFRGEMVPPSLTLASSVFTTPLPLFIIEGLDFFIDVVGLGPGPSRAFSGGWFGFLVSLVLASPASVLGRFLAPQATTVGLSCPFLKPFNLSLER